MKKYFFSFLFLFSSSCTFDTKSDKSKCSSSAGTFNKSACQKKESDLTVNQKIETTKNRDNSQTKTANTITNIKPDTETNRNTKHNSQTETTNTIANIKPDTETNQNTKHNSQTETENTIANIKPDTKTNQNTKHNSQTETENTIANIKPDTETNQNTKHNSQTETENTIANIKPDTETNRNTKHNSQTETENTIANIKPDTETNRNTKHNSQTETENTIANIKPDTETNRNTKHNSQTETTNTIANINLETKISLSKDSRGDSIEIIQDFSVRKSIQHFTKKQMQNLLNIHTNFSSPQDREAEIRHFVKTAFSLNKILKIAISHWRLDEQTSLKASHKKILIEFIEHYLLSWIGYSMLLPVKSIPSHYIDYTVKEPYVSKDNLYRVITKFNIMNLHSTEILWTVNTKSFPSQLVFLNVIIDGVSALHLLRDQMYYLFKQKQGNIDKIIFELQNKMNHSSFSNL